MDQAVEEKAPSKPEGNEDNLSAALSFCYEWTLTLEPEFDEVLRYSNSGTHDRDANILLTTKASRRISTEF